MRLLAGADPPQVIFFPSAGEYRGGSVHSSFLLFEELVRRGREAKLVFHGEGYARDLAVERGLPFIQIGRQDLSVDPSRKDRFRIGDLASTVACRNLIRRENATLVHVNDRRMLRTWALPAKTAGSVLLAHWRSVYLKSWSVDFGLKLAARIVCVSAYSRDLLPGWAQAKADVVYNPFRPSLDREAVAAARRSVRAAAGIPLDAAVIGFFGSLMDRKRPRMVLELLRRMKTTADGRPVYGAICGEIHEPRDDEYFRMLETENWDGRVIAAGHVQNAEEWMAACDVMVAPAVEEPLARVGVEAQGVGLPALVSSDGGLREVVEDGVSGLILPPDDVEAWLAATKRVLDDASLASRLSEGGLRAAARLTVERHADAIEAIYHQLLAPKAGAA